MKKPIAYFTRGFVTTTGESILNGVLAGAEKFGYDIIVINGNQPGINKEALIYDILNPDLFSGVISWASSESDQMASFLSRFSEIPLISVSLQIPGFTSVVVENSTGMRLLIEHLICEHKKEKIAFVRGPENHAYAIERFQAYLDTLRSYSLVINDKLIFNANGWVETGGVNAINAFLDERQLKIGIDIDTIVCANDYIAVGALEELRRRDIFIPEQVAIVGYNDVEEAQCSNPAITTVAMPFFNQGCFAVELIDKKLHSSQLDIVYKMSTDVVIRESCGCMTKHIRLSASNLSIENESKIESHFDLNIVKKDIDELLLKTKSPKGQFKENILNLLDELLGAIVKELETYEHKDYFLSAFSKLLRSFNAKEIDSYLLHNLISTINSYFASKISDFGAKLKLEDICKQCHILISDFSERIQRYKNIQMVLRERSLNALGSKLIADLPTLIKTVQNELPKLQIISFYLVMYEKYEKWDWKSVTPYSKLITGYNEAGPIASCDNEIFKTTDILPFGLLNSSTMKALLIMPLHFNDLHFGYVAIGIKKRVNGIVYDTIRSLLSSALYAVILKEIQTDELKKQEQIKHQFIGNIAHDLKTPLSVISGHTDILRSSFAEAKKESNYLNYISNSIQQINRLIDTLISIALLDAKDDKPNLAPYDYTLFLHQFCKQFELPAQKKSITLLDELPKDKIVISLDIIWAERIIGNLVQNAFKFTDNGGSIKIRMYKDSLFAYTEVTDTGCGIPKDKINFIFNRQYQANEEKKKFGFGLGLSIVKEMVTRLGGSIDVYSEENVYTTFKFTLPLHVDQYTIVANSIPENQSALTKRSNCDRRMEKRIQKIQEEIENNIDQSNLSIDTILYENKSQGRPTVLICEDTIGQIHLLIEALKNDYNLIFAKNGIEGLEKLQKYNKKIDLIISDVKMPEMDGLEFCKEFFSCEENKNIPFIFLTAFQNESDQLKVLSYGATDYLTKPFNREILKEKINHWLSRREHELMLYKMINTLEQKNSEISRLRSIISHEIKNPLTNLSGIYYFLAKLKNTFYNQSDDKYKKYWDRIDDISKISTRICGILDSAKIMETKMTSTMMVNEPICSLLDEAITETRHLMGDTKLLVNNPFTSSEIILCDKRMLTQVFVNIIRNGNEAIKEKRIPNGEIRINVIKEESKLLIKITDNGTGISNDNLNNLFKYQHTTKKDGNGIGLYFSKEILTIHGGDILVESSENECTTFSIVLPSS